MRVVVRAKNENVVMEDFNSTLDGLVHRRIAIFDSSLTRAEVGEVYDAGEILREFEEPEASE